MKGVIRLKPSFRFTPQSLSLPVLIFLIVVLLFIIFAWPDPASGHTALLAAEPTYTPTPTEVPGIYDQTPDQTVGVIIGAIVLILIIVGGTIGVLRRKNGDS
jgi:hypothetical protein